jgi:hypothetical protein
LFHARLSGPLADLAGPVGQRLGVFPTPIEHRLGGGEGTLCVGDTVRALDRCRSRGWMLLLGAVTAVDKNVA